MNLRRLSHAPLRLLVGIALVSFPMSSLSAALLARCGGSQGKALFVGAGETSWSDDAMRKGQFLFVTDDQGNPSLLYYDTTGLIHDVKNEGGLVWLSYKHPDKLSFGIIVSYQDEGIVETYNVVSKPSGGAELLWTVNRSGQPGMTKVGAYEAECTLGK